MAQDPRLRRQLAKEGRLYLLALVCALAGSLTVWRTGALGPGIAAFAVCLVVLGPLLWAYERRRR